MVNEYNDPGCRLEDEINLACFLARSEVNGPGIRSVVWVQGCPILCEGCFNPQFQSFSSPLKVTADKLAELILSQSGIDGVTFSGGEPFAQAVPLAEVGDRIRDAGLTVVTYSGYPYNKLATATCPGWQDLLSVTDLLISGPYISALHCTDALIGSKNQQIIPISGRITVPVTSAGSGLPGATSEFTISMDGAITATGFPDMTLLRELEARCRGI
jgi:anaerobic ribonucleoside-triphosphate reductase activating protein